MTSDRVQTSIWKLKLFGGFRLFDPDGFEIRTRSRRMVALLTLLALQRDLAVDRHSLAKIIYWDAEDNHDNLLKVLLSRTSRKMQSQHDSCLRITSDLVWLDESLIEIDVSVARGKLKQIEEQAKNGRPVSSLFDELGSFVAPIEVTMDTPNVNVAINQLKLMILRDIQSQVVPAAGAKHSVSIAALIDIMELEDPLSSNTCCLLMSIFSGLGDQASVHRTFANHECAISEEYGEAVSSTVSDAYAFALENDPFPGVSLTHDLPPPKHPVSIGFDKFLGDLETTLSESQIGDNFYLYGCKGAGKSHLLSRLWYKGRSTKRFSYLDCSNFGEDLSELSQSYRNCDVLLIDNFELLNIDILEFRKTTCFNQTILFAGCQPCLNAKVITINVPRLELGNRLEMGNAILLLTATTGHSSQESETNSADPDFKYLYQIAQLSCGVPGALISCGQIIRQLGAKSALTYIQRELTAFTASAVDSTTFSLRSDIVSRIRNLNDEQLDCCKLLTKLDTSISTDMIVDSANVSVTTINSLANLGLIQISNSGQIRIESSVCQVLKSSAIGSINPAIWIDFCENAVLWLERKSEAMSDNLEVADSFGALTNVCRALLERKDTKTGLQMFCTLSKWFPSTSVPEALTNRAEAIICSEPESSVSTLFHQVNAISSAHFFLGSHSRMLRILNWLTNHLAFQDATPLEQSKIYSNLGLAHCCIENNHLAKTNYEMALELAPNPKNSVVVNFNLACLAENNGQIKEALGLFELAASHYTDQADFRLMTQNTISILRLRHRLGIDSALSAELIKELFRESRASRDRRSQATLLLEIGELKHEQGDSVKGLYLMILGTLLTLQMGYNKSTISKILPTLVATADALRELNAVTLVDKFEVLVHQMQHDLDSDSWEVVPGDMLPKVLKELLLQSLGHPNLDESQFPHDLDYLIDETNLLDVESTENIPITSFIESLRSKAMRPEPALSSKVFE